MMKVDFKMKADFKMASDKESFIEKKQIFVDHCEQTYVMRYKLVVSNYGIDGLRLVFNSCIHKSF